CVNKGFNVIHGNLLNVSNQEELRDLFEVFLSFYYLEHIPNPVDFVTCLYKIIKPGGIGVIEVPNYDHAEKSGNWLEFTKDHRFYYRKRTLCYLLSRCGFNVEVMEENNGGHSLTAIVRKPKISDVTFSLMKNQMKKDIDEFKKLIDKLNGTFTIYGAGHYSQLLLNIIHKQYGIKPLHIFDSNRQKCGQKICGVVIEHGDRVIDMQNCDNIIIICGIYNDEVYNALVKKSVFKEIIKWG
ncbi:MAG: methyltransferase domain-containing protein, partial [Sphingobacterium sp.]